MKPFSLEEYLKNPSRKVITRDGRAVRIICTDRKDLYQHPIVALTEIDGTEQTYDYKADGLYITHAQSLRDLFFAPEKHEGWINIYNGNGYHYIGGMVPYSSKSEAIRHITKKLDYVATCKIEWEE